MFTSKPQNKSGTATGNRAPIPGSAPAVSTPPASMPMSMPARSQQQIPRGTTPKPDWREVILDAIDAKDTRDRHSFAVNLPPAWSKIVNGAAESRGMSVAAYVRRATLAFATHDLGIDWVELMPSEPLVSPYGVRPAKANVIAAEGFGFGSWKIVTLEEYARESDG